jgi:hypothetical protein
MKTKLVLTLTTLLALADVACAQGTRFTCQGCGGFSGNSSSGRWAGPSTFWS